VTATAGTSAQATYSLVINTPVVISSPPPSPTPTPPVLE
jgi:hypothetical protein